MPSISAQALLSACVAGDAASVSRLLPAGGTSSLNLSGPEFQHPDPTSKTTPLLVAAALGHTDIVRMLLARAPKTAVDYVDAQGATAMIMTSQYHHADNIPLLADCGANVNFMDQWRATPLSIAVAPINFINGVPSDQSPRNPDPGAELATVRALLRLGAGTLPLTRGPRNLYFTIFEPNNSMAGYLNISPR